MPKGLLKLRICALILIALVMCFIFAASKPAYAQEAGSSHMCYETSTTPMINGQWSSDWNSGLQTNFGTSANFTDEWYLAMASPSSVVYYYLLIETMDNTNNTGDFIQICFDGGMTSDSAPSSTDFAINFTSNAVCTWYQGNGLGWTKIATPPLSDFQWNESFSSSPSCSTPHLMLEISLLKTSTDLGGAQILGPEFWMLIETYDANSAGYGLQSWPTMPPSSPDVPSTYGDIPYARYAAPTFTTATATVAPTPTLTTTPTPTHTPTTTSIIVSTQPPTSTPSSSPTPPPANTNSTNSNISKPAQSFQDIVFLALIMFAEFAIVVSLTKRHRRPTNNG